MPKIEPNGKICCLLGDICTVKKKSEYEKLLTELSPHYEHILVLLGNHEFYHGEYAAIKEEWKQFINEDIVQKQITNVKLLDCDRFDVTEHNIRFLGATLWTHVSEENVVDVESTIKDYAVITCSGHKSKVTDTNQWHDRELAWLKNELEEARQNQVKVVVLSHHAPTHKKTSSPEFSSSNHDKIKEAFASDDTEQALKDFSDVIQVWCYGHTHFNNDQKIHGVRVVSNQLGYFMRGERNKFQPGMVIHL
jgi:predicted phosphodiesterase